MLGDFCVRIKTLDSFFFFLIMGYMRKYLCINRRVRVVKKSCYIRGFERERVKKENINQLVILNWIQDLLRFLLTLKNSMRGRFQIKFGMTPLLNDGAFTLIEILVVVLIIGILAAIALSQYQKAVLRAQFQPYLFETRAIYRAEQLYYLEHGIYGAINKLDVQSSRAASNATGEWNSDFYWNGVQFRLKIETGKLLCYHYKNLAKKTFCSKLLLSGGECGTNTCTITTFH